MKVTVIKSRRKTIAIQVNSDLSVTVRAPYGVTEKYIEEFLNKNEAWISKRMNEIKVKKKSIESKNVENVTLDKIKILADQALKIIPTRVEYFARIIGVAYGNITIRNQKTRWGSCSSKGNLNFPLMELVSFSVVMPLLPYMIRGTSASSPPTLINSNQSLNPFP